MLKIRLAALTLIAFCKLDVYAQTISRQPDWPRIERNISSNTFIANAKRELQAIKQEALARHDDIAVARSLNNLLLIQDRLTEDTLYFRNSAFLDTLLNAKGTSQKLLAMLYVMRAQRINKFDARYNRFNYAAYRSKKLNPDYAGFTPAQRDSLVASDLENAAIFNVSPGDIDKMLWLSSNPDVFIFNPTFKDIVYSEYVNLAAIKRRYNYQPPIFQNWLTLPSPAFRKKLDSLATSGNNADKTLTGYRHWLFYHKKNAAVAAFIESLSRKYIYLQAGADSLARVDYTAYLEKGISSKYPELKAHSVYQLCLIWNEEGKKYAGADNFYFDTRGGFDMRYQYYPQKALQLYEQQKNMLANFSVFNAVLAEMAIQIKAKGLRISIGDRHIPGEAIPFKAMYKNTDTLYYRVIKIPAAEAPKKDTVAATSRLLNVAPVAQGIFALPLPPDHNKHAVYLKLAALPAGKYRFLFANKPLSVNGTAINNITFSVTGIAAINNDETIFVLDRKTGVPLTEAKIKAFANKIFLTNYNSVNKSGYITANSSLADSLSISLENDTSAYRIAINEHFYPSQDDSYNIAQFDSPSDFFSRKARIEIFTDRSIYRPGQTVHYKIIMFTRDTKTGEAVVINKQNLGSNYKALIKQWINNGGNLLVLTDPFSHKIDSAKFTLNGFGSFAGQFIIPKTAATGRWQIKSEQDNGYQNSGEFSVEEYKRPSIEMTVSEQKKMLVPGQPFTVIIKLRSLSGADLSHILVTYQLNRSGNLPLPESRVGKPANIYKNISLMDKTGYTNEKGELSINVNDSSLAKVILPDTRNWEFNYALTANAVDATGESAEVRSRVTVSSRPLNIYVPVAPVYDRQLLPVLKLTASNVFEGILARTVNVRLYKVSNPTITETKLKEVDQWYYNEAEWAKWFPKMAAAKMQPAEKVLVLDTTVNTADGGSIILNKLIIITGFYKLEATCMNGDHIAGQYLTDFKVFDSNKGTSPETDINYIERKDVKPGEVISWYSFAKTDNFTIYQVLYRTVKEKMQVNTVYETRFEKEGLRKWDYRVPKDATGDIVLTRFLIKDNDVIRKEQRLSVTKPPEAQPEIIVEHYRKIMLPGSQQTFTLSVKTKNTNIAAEILTTMYDAALDKLQQHNWRTPYLSRSDRYLNANWRDVISTTKVVGRSLDNFGTATTINGKNYYFSEKDELQGKALGLSITNASGLNEVVVTGYGQQRRDVSSSVSQVFIRGINSLDYNQPLVIVDGVALSGGFSSINPNSITAIAVFKGADAVALYGSRAAGGVVVVSTKGPIVLPGSADEPVVKVRKNFSETAFFYPQVHADKEGYYKFSFSMPETATEWNWKIFAHTTSAKFAVAERKLQTQLNLMVQPNMPRLLYQGDKIILRSRVSNLDTVFVKGNATCRIEDAVTGENLTARLTPYISQPFNLDKKSTGDVSFGLTVPPGQLNPLKIVISAISGSVADAEEHTLPVLSASVFMRQSQAVVFGTQPMLTVPSLKLPVNAQMFGASLSIAQKPQASLLYALPYLATYPYDCAEQTFNKLRAAVTGVRIMQTDQNAQKSYLDAKNKTLKESAIPAGIAEETMPWLNIANKTVLEQQQLLKLLDTSLAKAAIYKHLQRLYKLQTADGGLCWFEGGSSSEYISAYVLAGFAQLQSQGWKPDSDKTNLYQQFITKLVKYQADKLILSANDKIDLYQLYAISYWLKEYPIPANTTQKINKALTTAWQRAENQSLAQQALLIINTYRYNDAGTPLRVKAVRQLDNIRQLAIEDVTNGIRWKELADAEELNMSAEETIALLAEAFEVSGKYQDVNSGIVKWLLTTRQDQNWRSTKTTAAAINILQKEKGTTFGDSNGMSANIEGHSLNVTNGLLSGTTVAFAPVKIQPAELQLQQQGTNTRGALTWYYFGNPADIDTLNKSIKITRELYIIDKPNGWVKITEPTVLKAGDRVQVKLTIETGTRLKFVHITDPRAAAFEPLDNKSGYQYNDGLTYYRSVRDAGSDLFAESMPKGISTITYDLTVAHTGDFNCGPAQLECMYNPTLNGYSATQRIITEQ